MTSAVVPTTKRSLVVLCHAMERAFMVANDGCSAGLPGLVLGLFQRREYFDVEADRYAAFAAAGDTVIVGFTGSAAADHLVYSIEAGQRRLIKLRAALDDTQSVAERDQLTGLYNRHFLERFLGGADRPAELVAMLVDVDNLKTINDTNGHDAGDAVLSAIAAILKGESRAGDVVIRWGGDEFLLLVPQMTEDEAAVYAQNVLHAVSSGRPLPPWNTLDMSVSIGMIPTHRTPLPLDQLDQLDQALYQAKRAGKGRAVVSGNSGWPQDGQTNS